jgi:hypothetical protein
MSNYRDESNTSEIEDEFYYCECECEKCDDETADFDCDCECTSFEQQLITLKGTQIKTSRIPVPRIKMTLPVRTNSKKTPINRPIKVRIPRAIICKSLPKGSVRTELCEPEKMNRKTVDNGTINVCTLIYPGAHVGSSPFKTSSKIPIRVRLDFEAANKIWQQQVNGITQGIKFNLFHISVMEKNLLGVGGNVQDFPWNQANIGKILFEYGKRACPNAHVFVYYMPGNHIGPLSSNSARTDAITFRTEPVIILSNSALLNNYILAHELGHFMYLNNLFGYKFDPDPLPFDPDHNANPTNLMYDKSDHWPSAPHKPTLTPAQIRKALNTRFFYE